MTKNPGALPLTAEQEVLLGIVRVDGAQDDRIRELIGRGLDWATLRQTALDHGLIPLLYTRLKAVAEDLLPPAERAELRQLYLANAQRNMRLAQELLRVLRFLASQEIVALPLKGPVLAAQVYGDVSMRTISDLDILIHRQDFARAYDLLPQIGYNPRLPLSTRQGKWILRAATELEFTNQGRLLDVHWAVYQWLWPIKSDVFWQELQSVRLNGVNVRVLSLENTLLMLCVIGARDQWFQLRLIADLAHLLHAHPELDWEALLERAHRLGARKLLCLGLCLAHEVGGVALPPKVRDSTRLDRGARGLADGLKERFFISVDERREQSASLFPLSERLRDSLYYALTPKQKDWEFVNLPAPLYPLYYLVRPLRLLVTRSAAFIHSLARWFIRPVDKSSAPDSERPTMNRAG